ncbi:DUF2637 domain-containing protein [Streptomyces halobius]|uniref:DUF2637 domain-containing protein n=1 Tax=Streptomyces halobius TaxID=2879846 RepID=A0ABY4M9Y3_9ACTN|nr:DUF2637 domain-containing protein [Streptomyces halobius]UQA94596.1 DUF2637 domain-containing protein [Streptomyces halobius]
MAAPLKLTRTHRILIGVVITGAVVIAGIGFAGSYAAVRELAIKKGFGDFASFFPIGIDAGIVVLLALDLLLTWIRMPFPLLRQTAWLLTVATVAFNAAVATDPLGMGMHAVIPVLFVVTVEAARHAVGRIADITADKHMEGVRITRWLLSPLPTFLLWRRMKLWELRSYDAVIKLEQERLVYQARLRSRFGRGWRRKAPVESLMPLRLARYGVPLAETAPAGLAAAGIEPQLLPAPQQSVTPALEPKAQQPAEEVPSQWFAAPRQVTYQGDYDPTYVPEQAHQPSHEQQHQPKYDEHQQAPTHEQVPVPAPRMPDPEPQFPVPTGAGGTRPLGKGNPEAEPQPAQAPAAAPTDEDLYQVFRRSIEGEGMPTPGAFAANLEAQYGIRLRTRELNRYMDRFSDRLNAELMDEHIA